MEDIIFKRKSIRKFKDREVEEEKINRILKAGMQAPSAFNTQSWEFIVVKNKDTIKKVSNMSKYSKPAAKANTIIIILSNLNKVKKTKPWITQDLSACCENILLEAVNQDLGGVWLGLYPDEDRIKIINEIFDLPDNIIPFSVIALGYPENDGKIQDRYDSSKIHYEEY